MWVIMWVFVVRRWAHRVMLGRRGRWIGTGRRNRWRGAVYGILSRVSRDAEQNARAENARAENARAENAKAHIVRARPGIYIRHPRRRHVSPRTLAYHER